MLFLAACELSYCEAYSEDGMLFLVLVLHDVAEMKRHVQDSIL